MKRTNNNQRIIYKALYIFFIILILTTPLFFNALNYIGNKLTRGSSFYNTNKGNIFNEIPLNGSETPPTLKKLNLISLKDGTFQKSFENYFAYNLSWRKIITRIYNQLLRSLFNSTDSSSIIIGKDNTLFEKYYIYALLKNITENDKLLLQKQLSKIEELYSLLLERDILLLIAITPSKASIYPEKLPHGYDRYYNNRGLNFYDYFNEIKNNYNFPILDLHEYFLQEKEEGHIIFSKGGTHWSYLYVHEYINRLNSIISSYKNQSMGFLKLENVSLKYRNAFDTDSDIETLLNDAVYWNEKYLSPHVTFSTKNTNYTPNLFICHGSFFWTLINTVYNSFNTQKDFIKPLWNTVYSSFYNGKLQSFTYDDDKRILNKELISNSTENWDYISSTDIIIIEFNEQVISPEANQFMFIDNLLKHLNGLSK